MAFGVTRHAHMRDAMPLEQARLEQPEARLERPTRPVAVAGDHQSAVDTRLACCARQIFVERVAAGDPARRDDNSSEVPTSKAWMFRRSSPGDAQAGRVAPGSTVRPACMRLSRACARSRRTRRGTRGPCGD